MVTNASGYITDVDYIPGYYAHLSPTVMRFAASLNHVAPPSTDGGFRYLELGCGLGRSLTILAAANPQGEFVGVDVNPNHIAAVEKDVAMGGLPNVRAIAADFSGLTPDIGTFDFIAIHGVFSWVADEVRQQLLSIAKTHLTPGGLLLVSYNAMPGWAHLQPIRGILRQYAALREGDSAERIREALGYLVFIRDKQARYFEDNPRAAAYCDSLVKQDVQYLAHEYLNEHWTSFYFSEVAGMFGDFGLSFVGSLPVHTNFWDLCVRPEFQDLFRTTSDRLVTETHKDFCANTAFRWDLYSREPTLARGPEARLKSTADLHFRVARPGITLPHKVDLGVVASTVQGPIYEKVLSVFSGEAMRIAEASQREELRDVPLADLARAIDACVALGLLEVTSGRVPAAGSKPWGSATEISTFNLGVLGAGALMGRPVALASTRSGHGHVLGDFEAAILLELSQGGKRGLVERMESRLAKSGRTLQQNGAAVTDAGVRRQLVDGACSAFLQSTVPGLAQLGIVELI